MLGLTGSNWRKLGIITSLVQWEEVKEGEEEISHTNNNSTDEYFCISSVHLQYNRFALKKSRSWSEIGDFVKNNFKTRFSLS